MSLQIFLYIHSSTLIKVLESAISTAWACTSEDVSRLVHVVGQYLTERPPTPPIPVEDDGAGDDERIFQRLQKSAERYISGPSWVSDIRRWHRVEDMLEAAEVNGSLSDALEEERAYERQRRWEERRGKVRCGQAKLCKECEPRAGSRRHLGKSAVAR